MGMNRKTLRRLPPTAREIAKALNDIERGFRVIDRLFGPKEPRQGLMNIIEMEIMAQAIRNHMPKASRKKKAKVDAVVCSEHGTRLDYKCSECLKAWEANSHTALGLRAADKAYGD